MALDPDVRPDTAHGREQWAAPDVRHEFTNGVAALLVAAETLRDRRDDLSDAAVDGLVELVLSRVQRLRHVLADLEADVEPPAPLVGLRDVHLGPIVRTAADAVEHAATQLVIDLDDDLVVHADHDRLTSILRQLLREAVAHGRGTVRVEGRGAAAGWVVLTLHDDGTDVDPRVEAHVRERYVDGESAGVRAGTGFGLVAVRALVASMGGRIDFEVDEGGARFTLRLRAAELPADVVPVQGDPRSALDELAGLVLDGLGDGDGVLVLSTGARLDALRRRVADVPVVATALASRRLRLLDAAAVVDELLPTMGLEPEDLRRTLGVLVRDLAAEHGHATVHSELADVLRDRGAHDVADNVVEAWHLVGESVPLRVVEVAATSPKDADGLFARVLRAHAAHLPDEG